MSLNFSVIQPYLAILLPLVMPYLASGLAAILAQDGFDAKSPLINDSLAWAFLLVASVGSGIVDNQFLNTPDVAVNAIVSIATLLLAGPLTSLRPWINFTGFLQSRVFSVVKQGGVNLTTQEARGQAFNATQVVTPDMLSSMAQEITTGLQGLFTAPTPVQQQPVQVSSAIRATASNNITPFSVPNRPQLPQALPVVAPPPPVQPATPVAQPLQGDTTVGSTPFQRHFGDSAVMPVVPSQL